MEKHPQSAGKSRPPRAAHDAHAAQNTRSDHDLSNSLDTHASPNDRKKTRDDGAKKVEDEPEIREDKPNRADFHHGSTTQAGSDYGQGSHDLPDQENHQDSQSNDLRASRLIPRHPLSPQFRHRVAASRSPRA